MAEARARLAERFGLTDRQVDAIVGMQLRSLVGLERLKVEQEHKDLLAEIKEYQGILADRRKVVAIVREDLLDVRSTFGDERRTTITGEAQILEREDLIPDEDVIVTVTYKGYAKRATPDEFRSQGRGGKGVIGTDLGADDFVTDVFTASTHDYILFFTNLGLVYWPKVFLIPEMRRTAKGRALVNILPLREGETITGMIPVREFEQEGYLLMATALGKVKKTALSAFGKRGSGGIIAIDLAEGDRLLGVRKTTADQEVILGTSKGRAIRFHEDDVRPMGRNAAGVRGIRLRGKDRAVDLALVREDASLLTVCENGYGKRTQFDEYPTRSRGGMGVIGIRTSRRNGPVVAMREVTEDQELFLITEQGMAVRISVDSISCIGRNTQGVKLITTEKGDKVSGVAVIVPEEEEDDEEYDEEAS